MTVSIHRLHLVQIAPSGIDAQNFQRTFEV